jgi:hypothetical protein
MTTIEFDKEFELMVQEILTSPSGEINPVHDQIDSRLANAAQFAIWEAENPQIIRGEE